MNTSVLSQYPFSLDYRQKLEQDLGMTPSYITVSELRDLGIPEIWKRLRAIEADRLLIPLEDENAHAVLPLLKIMAGISSARQVSILTAGHKCVTAKRTGLVNDVLTVGRASVAGRLAAASAEREITSLLKAPRIPAFTSDSDKVLFINSTLWFGIKAGGSVGHIAGVINALSQSGHDVLYAAVSPNPLVQRQVRHQLLRSPASFSFPLENTQYLFDKSITKQMMRQFTGTEFRFIYQRMSLGNFTGVKMSRRMRVPYIVEYNGSEAWIAQNWGRPLKNYKLAVSAEDVCLKHAHVVVTISKPLKEELIARGVEERRIAFYPNCIDEKIFDPCRFSAAEREQIRKRYHIPADAIVIGFIGTFGQWHGVEILAQAIRKLYDEQRQWLQERKIHFMLMGDGSRMPLVRNILGITPSGPFWTLTGLISQADAPAHLASTDILVSPHVPNADGTRFFGSPTKLFEYMAMAKAIVASDLDQIGDVLQNSLRSHSLPADEPDGNESLLAVLCRPGDITELIKGIQFAANHPKWRGLLGQNVRLEALAKYTWRIHVARILETINNVQDRGTEGV